MKAFRRLREHWRRPLLRPEANRGERTFIAPGKFAERAAMSLRINRARENFHSGNPGCRHLGDSRSAVANFPASKLYRSRSGRLPSHSRAWPALSGLLGKTRPELAIGFVHKGSVSGLTRSQRAREKGSGCNKDHMPADPASVHA